LPLLTQAASENSTYYSVRPDMRMCPSPMCGGVFVQRVNRPATPCADGSRQTECYVASIDLSALGLPAEQEATVLSGIQSGAALLKGSLRHKDYEGIGPLGEFVATEVWEAATSKPARGTFFRVKDNGLKCIAAPCPSYQEFRLNSDAQRDIAEVDLSRSGATDKQIELAHAALTQPAGVLMAGRHRPVTGPAGRSAAIVASQFYLPVVANVITPNPKTCYVGGCSAELCSDKPGGISICWWKPEFACYRQAVCEQQTDGNCGWTQTQALQDCIAKAQSEAGPAVLLKK